MVKLSWTAAKFLWFIYFTFCSQITFSYRGMMMISLTPSPQIAAILSGVTSNLWSLFSGFALPHPVRNLVSLSFGFVQTSLQTWSAFGMIHFIMLG